MPPDGVLDIRRHLWTSQLLPLLTDAVETGKDPAACDRSLLFAEHARSGSWPIPLDGLLVGTEGNASSIEFGESVRHVEHAATKPVDGLDHQDIEPAAHYILEHRVECWALIPTIP